MPEAEEAASAGAERSAVDAAITHLAREEGGRVLALLAARLDDVDLADDAVQDALVRAVEAWRVRGIPANPPGWLYTVAYNRAIDLVRRRGAAQRRLAHAAPELVLEPEPAERDPVVEQSIVGDEELRLMLLCCHPALDTSTQIALTLRLVGGLTTAEIASAFLVPEPTMAQRIVRAKAKIRDARIPLTVPKDLDTRVEALLAVLYLVFNEGYLPARDDAAVRVDLAERAIRLTEAAAAMLPGRAEVLGLLSLELSTSARTRARAASPTADLVLLDDQDRTLWDRDRIARANRLLTAALALDQPGVCQLQAMIAAQHANATSVATTDWALIARLYDQVWRATGNPVVLVNRAVAVAMTDGPAAGLALLDTVEGLGGYHLLHAARAELLLLAGDREGAAAAFGSAAAHATNPAEQRHLARRIAATSPR